MDRPIHLPHTLHIWQNKSLVNESFFHNQSIILQSARNIVLYPNAISWDDQYAFKGNLATSAALGRLAMRLELFRQYPHPSLLSPWPPGMLPSHRECREEEKRASSRLPMLSLLKGWIQANRWSTGLGACTSVYLFKIVISCLISFDSRSNNCKDRRTTKVSSEKLKRIQIESLKMQ